MTRLEAVNYILGRCGRGAVPALQTGTNSEAAFAERELERADLTVQKVGWHYNVRRDVTLSTDADDKLPVPDSVIWIDSDKEDSYRNVTQNGDFLYDLDENRDTFPDISSMKVRYCLRLTLECIPLPVREYIVLTAAYNFITHYGSRFMAPNDLARARADLFAERTEAQAEAKRFQASTRNANILATEDVRAVTGDRTRRFPLSNRRRW